MADKQIFFSIYLTHFKPILWIRKLLTLQLFLIKTLLTNVMEIRTKKCFHLWLCKGNSIHLQPRGPFYLLISQRAINQIHIYLLSLGNALGPQVCLLVGLN